MQLFCGLDCLYWHIVHYNWLGGMAPSTPPPPPVPHNPPLSIFLQQ